MNYYKNKYPLSQLMLNNIISEENEMLTTLLNIIPNSHNSDIPLISFNKIRYGSNGSYNDISEHDIIPLITACENESDIIIKYLIKCGANVNIKCSTYINKYSEGLLKNTIKTPLSIACEKGNEFIVQYLIEHGANVNDIDVKYNYNYDIIKTPLIIACEKNNEPIIKYLIDHGANIDIQCKYKYKNKYRRYIIKKPLIIACEKKNEFLVKYLIDHGANVNDINTEYRYGFNIIKTPLYIACENGNEFIVKCLVEYGANVNVECAYEYDIEYGEENNYITPLGIACRKNYGSIIKYLIEHGANVNVKCKCEYDSIKTPLCIAFDKKNESVIKCLVEHGADVNVECKYRFTYVHDNYDIETPLTIACKKNNEFLVKYLIEHGANVNSEFKCVYDNGIDIIETPLIIACKKNNEFLVKYLIEHGANVNFKCKCSYNSTKTALCIACENGNNSIVKHLVDHGANVNYELKEYSYIKNILKNSSMKNYLIENNNNRTIKKDIGLKYIYSTKTPLSIACENENEFIIKYLIDHGANVNAELKEECRDFEKPKYRKKYTAEYLIEQDSTIYFKLRTRYSIKTPLNIVYEKGNEAIKQYFMEHGANFSIELKGKYYDIESIPCKKENEALINILLKYGAYVNEEYEQYLEDYSLYSNGVLKKLQQKKDNKLNNRKNMRKKIKDITIKKEKILNKIINTKINITEY